LRQPFRVLRDKTYAPGTQGPEAIPYVPGTVPAKHRDLRYSPKGEEVAAFSQIARAIIISHDCEIDKDKKHAIVALIRSFDESQPETSKQVIRSNKKLSFFHLPALENVLPESYVDFRRITSLEPTYLEPTKRIASLSDAAVSLLQLLFFRYLTRLELDPKKLPEMTGIEG
jgi:hypothetical protein